MTSRLGGSRITYPGAGIAYAVSLPNVKSTGARLPSRPSERWRLNDPTPQSSQRKLGPSAAEDPGPVHSLDKLWAHPFSVGFRSRWARLNPSSAAECHS